ncbi:hypothetical protein [Pseudonocardia alni]
MSGKEGQAPRYGPPGRRVGRYIRYDPDDVRSWFRAQRDGIA